ncbi:sugar phosphate nucleotidyltransferase [Porcipelethomonas sp.]|uniref:sugar phosphate nucleotidyltransferase n=1 Tax=Porcipelethomonas sp. TaxID=2981675 RepID=UPI003EF5B8C6
MNFILLSGGSGKRLWPLSNDVRSKQFIKIFKNGNTYESMVQRVYRQIHNVSENADITIATSRTQVSSIKNQLGDNVDICVEPCRRDTFPAIALAAAYLSDVKKIPLNQAVAICPVDPYVNKDYFEAIAELQKKAEKETIGLFLMGIEPTCPSEKYGYIIPETSNQISKVKSFKEKPTSDIAKKYISQGALWNCGVFVFKLEYIISKAHELIDFTDYYDLFDKYSSLEKISFDYAVAEKEKNINVMRFSGYWNDLGTWDSLTNEISENKIGKAILNNTCENTFVVNELNIPVLCMGIKNTIVSASAEGILVSEKSESGNIKSFVDNIEQEIMFAEKSWGSYTVIDIQDDSMTLKVTLNPGNSMNYHSHEHRDEVWTIISGTGRTIVDGMEEPVKPGDVITMEAGCKHTIFADTELKLIEVQLGKEISVHDKQIFKL